MTKQRQIQVRLRVHLSNAVSYYFIDKQRLDFDFVHHKLEQ